MPKFRQWTPIEVEIAQYWRARGCENVQIAFLIGRKTKSVGCMFRAYGSKPLEKFLLTRIRMAKQRRDNCIKQSEKWAEYRERKRLEGKRRYARDYQSPYRVHQVEKIPIPPEVIADRDRRADEYRTPQEILMGDPGPLRSVLGRRT